jgi:hypothetical protein
MVSSRSAEQRKFQRFDSERDVLFDFVYDFESPVTIEKVSDGDSCQGVFRYNAVTKNVSLEGLCFLSEQEVQLGDLLNMEVFIPGDHQPVRLLGEVRWTSPREQANDSRSRFEAGVVLRTVEGKGVRETIRFDEDYHVYWSDVLESILGRFRVLQGRKTGSGSSPTGA